MARGRNVINQAIALEGGDEIVAQLRKMGAEGERDKDKGTDGQLAATSSRDRPTVKRLNEGKREAKGVLWANSKHT